MRVAIRRGRSSTWPNSSSAKIDARLLADKDAAHYSPVLITVEKAKGMVRQAAALLAEADRL